LPKTLKIFVSAVIPNRDPISPEPGKGQAGAGGKR